MFDYFKTQYLFSASTILAVSSLLGTNRSQSDEDHFNNAVEILKQLDQGGNFGAEEFCQHLDAMKKSMENANQVRHGDSQATTLSSESMGPETGLFYTNLGITAGMALAEASLQEVLAEPDLNLQLFDTPSFDGLQTPFWPELWGDGWTAG
jgi:proline utilization trans-activator